MSERGVCICPACGCQFSGDAAIMGHDLMRAEDTQDYDRALVDAGARSQTLPGGRG